METEHDEPKIRQLYWPWLVLIGVVAFSIGICVALRADSGGGGHGASTDRLLWHR